MSQVKHRAGSAQDSSGVQTSKLPVPTLVEHILFPPHEEVAFLSSQDHGILSNFHFPHWNQFLNF